MAALIGCSGWSYADSFDKGGWVKLFYPNAQTRKLQYYAQFFDSAEWMPRSMKNFTEILE
jgi:uncharacterized protein YecE (DUF72 family)